MNKAPTIPKESLCGKSMAYVGNIAAFIKYHLQNTQPGYQVFNYIDKPDLNMNDLVAQVEKSLSKNIPSTHFPYWLGMLGGYGFDILGKLTGPCWRTFAMCASFGTKERIIGFDK